MIKEDLLISVTTTRRFATSRTFLPQRRMAIKDGIDAGFAHDIPQRTSEKRFALRDSLYSGEHVILVEPSPKRIAHASSVFAAGEPTLPSTSIAHMQCVTFGRK